MEAKDKIIVALDVSDVKKAIELVKLLSPYVGFFKIGLEFIWSMIANLLVSTESEAVDLLLALRNLASEIGAEHCFIDAKLCDIPNTIKGASAAISRTGARMFNIHASAGIEAIKAAVENAKGSFVLGVTVLTSITENECLSIFGDDPGIKVVEFAEMLDQMGADGVICSPIELEPLSRAHLEEEFLRITPGVRPEWAAKGDQKRVMTPAEAIKAGANYLVIGRPITNPPAEIGTPVDAAKRIAEEIVSVM